MKVLNIFFKYALHDFIKWWYDSDSTISQLFNALGGRGCNGLCQEMVETIFLTLKKTKTNGNQNKSELTTKTNFLGSYLSLKGCLLRSSPRNPSWTICFLFFDLSLKTDTNEISPIKMSTLKSIYTWLLLAPLKWPLNRNLSS